MFGIQKVSSTMEHKADLRSTAYYYRKDDRPNPLSAQQFYHVGLGMYGGPNGTYGSYILGPTMTPLDLKYERERRSGE